MIYQLTIFTIMAIGTITAKYSLVYKAEPSAFTKCANVSTFDQNNKNWFVFKNGYMKPDPVQWPGNATIAVTLAIGCGHYPARECLNLWKRAYLIIQLTHDSTLGWL